MEIELHTPRTDELDAAVAALRSWQSDDAPLQLHPGDLGWFWQLGAEKTAASVRTWTRDGEIAAVGFLDGPDVLRVTTAPDLMHDEALARRMAADLDDPERGVLPAGKVNAEIPTGAALNESLAETGWDTDEAWTPLRRDLSGPVEDSGLRIEVAGPEDAELRAALQRSAFEGSTFSVERWQAMAEGPAYADARCLIGFDEDGVAVAMVTVWSAGPGRPGLVEPMGVHADHRGRGHGKAICVAAAAALQELGSSSAMVATPSSLVSAVATYRAAGFVPLPERFDRHRAA
ncbi:GNAT family N-acetyltransferase [Glycomyces algeriensis]|uniref:N-acetyltransferase n=1 Tax=Glycomyces algeriensis TaxID=256037 RepID=A0A9W6LGZ9_9ACTN|nr:GNAT family N-acetyltransferase [Glycomyces algeriensis]MDA1364917.1 GNAT family N-acetyltransferase [Glycomyces algeriensis]MDR7350023.1 ribosomal protein S18 acetylase RimI-like enzyme [Glycomyces algeriensis]GLI42735.1 N-acetyltransferase [Glycomyces algeriensis]